MEQGTLFCSQVCSFLRCLCVCRRAFWVSVSPFVKWWEFLIALQLPKTLSANLNQQLHHGCMTWSLKDRCVHGSLCMCRDVHHSWKAEKAPVSISSGRDAQKEFYLDTGRRPDR